STACLLGWFLFFVSAGGRWVVFMNVKLFNIDTLYPFENMSGPFKGDWIDCAKKMKSSAVWRGGGKVNAKR
ncbi:hypothetical protein ACVGW2_20975, partial [Enterobacter intestinihominis]